MIEFFICAGVIVLFLALCIVMIGDDDDEELP